MVQPSLHQWLKHRYRAASCLSFRERRMVFNEDSEKGLWKDLEASRTPPENTKPFEVHVPHQNKEMKRLLKDADEEQIFINQTIEGTLSIWDFGSMLSEAGIRKIIKKQDLEELDRFFDLIETRKRQHEALVEPSVSQVVARKHVQAALERGVEVYDENDFLFNEIEKEKARTIQKEAEKKTEVEFKNFRRGHVVRSSLKKVREFLEHRQGLRMKALKEYLERKYEKFLTDFEEHAALFENEILFEEESQKSKKLKNRLWRFGEKIQTLPSPNSKKNLAEIKQMDEELKGIQSSFQEQLPKLKEVEQHRETVVQTIAENYQRTVRFHEQVEAKHVQNLIQMMEDGQDGRFAYMSKEERKKSIQLLKNWLKGMQPGGPMDKAHFADLLELHKENLGDLARLAEPGLSQEEQDKILAPLRHTSAEKLLRLHQKLSKATPPEDFQELMEEMAKENKEAEREFTAQNAKHCIDGLDYLQNASFEETIKFVREHLNRDGKQRVEIVNSGQFKHYDLGPGKHPRYVDLRRFTTSKGGMVFHQRGDEWNIIINEDKFRSGELTLEELKRQIRHELLHVELEHLPEEEQKRIMGKITGRGDWPQLKEWFLKLEKRPPDLKKGWTDYDIAHELYAMQFDLGNEEIDEKTIAALEPKDQARARLNNAFCGPGLKTAEDLFRGMEDGAEDILAKEKVNPSAIPKESESSEDQTKSYEENRKEIEGYEGQLNGFLDSPTAGKLKGLKPHLRKLKRENKKTDEDNEFFAQHPKSRLLAKHVTERNKIMKEAIEEVDEAINETQKNEDRSGGKFLQQLRNNTTWISATGIKKAAVKFFNYLKEWSELNTDDEGDLLGKSLLGDTRMGRKYASSLAGNEDKQVNNWQEGMKEYSPKQLLDNLKKMANSFNPNRYEFKATLRLLAEEGRLQWDNKNLWKVINRLQNATHFNLKDEQLAKNKNAIDEKMKRALSQIFDENEFISLKQKNDSSYDGKKNNSKEEARQAGGALTSMFFQMLRDKESGVDVEPYRLEGFLEYAITVGKSEPEYILFSIMAGVARGILSPSRVVVLNEKSSTLPHLDYFLTLAGQGKLTQEGAAEICKKHFKYAYDQGGLDNKRSLREFRKFMMTEMEADGSVEYRTNYTASSLGDLPWDKDHGRVVGRMASADAMDNRLRGQSGKKSLEPNRRDNFLVGALEAMEEYAVYYDELGEQKVAALFARLAGNFAMQHGSYSGIYDAENPHRARYGPNNIRSQMSSNTNHPNWTVQENVQKMIQFLEKIDKTFFEAIFYEGFAKNPTEQMGLKRVNRVCAEIGFGPFKHIDEVYKNLGNIIPKVVSRASKRGALSNIKQLAPFKNPLQAH